MTTKKLAQFLAEFVKYRQPDAVANFNPTTWPGWARMASESLAETVPYKTVGALAQSAGERAFLAMRPEPARGADHFVVYEALPGGTTRLTLVRRVAADDWRSVQAHTWEEDED